MKVFSLILNVFEAKTLKYLIRKFIFIQGYVKSLMHIRHENIVSYMGASLDASQILLDCTIITNPVNSESLYCKLNERHGSDLDVSAKMTIAKQVSLFPSKLFISKTGMV